MIRFIIAAAVLTLASPALAQQQQPASATALQIHGAISAMALELDQSRQVTQTLQKQLADAQARVKELEAKPAEK